MLYIPLSLAVGAGYARPSTLPYLPLNGQQLLCGGPGMPGPYMAPYNLFFRITANTSGGKTSGHFSGGIFPLRISLDAQG